MNTNPMAPVNKLPGAIAALTLGVLAGLLSWQSHADLGSASIRGQIAMADSGDLSLTVMNVESGHAAAVPVADDGSYAITGLAPGKYRVLATANGREYRSETLNVALGQVAVVDIASAGSAAMEEIVVTAKALKEAFTAEIGTSLSPELIGRLPQGNRNFLSFADLAPGVVSRPNANGDIQFRSGAQRASQVNVFIDGISQKDFVLAGGLTGQDSSRGNPFPQSAIAEYKVISSNFKAEFDQIGSAAIVAVTQRGSNEFHGGAFYDFTDSSLRAQTPNERAPGAQKAKNEQQQWGFWSSGPLYRNTLHYYLSFERKDNTELREFAAGGPASLADNLPADIRAAIDANSGTFTAPFKENLWFAKLNWNIDDRHHLEFSYRRRDDRDLRSVGGINTREAGVKGIFTETRAGLTHEYRYANRFNQLSLTYEQASRKPTPLNIAPGRAIFLAERPGEPGTALVTLGGARDFQNKGQQGLGIQNDLTLGGLFLKGEHTFKAGFKYKQLDLDGVEINPFNPQVLYSLESHRINANTDRAGILQAVPFRIEFTRPVSAAAPFVAARVRRFGVYIQDTWELGERLTLDLGLRWDTEDNDLYRNYRTPADVVAALLANPNINHPDSGVRIERFISTGRERGRSGGNLAPRFGFSYALSDAHTLFGGYGRTYNRVQFDFLQLEATRERFSRFAVNFSGDHSQNCFAPCVPFDPALLQPGGVAALPPGSREVFANDNDLKTPFSDQLSLGLRSAWGHIKTEIGYNRVASRDGFVFRLGNRRPGGLFYPPGASFSNAPFGESISDRFSVLLLGTNGAESNTDSFYLKFEKPQGDSSWSASLTYTYADAEENVRFFGPFDGLDTPNGDAFGFFPSAGVSKHAVVGAFTWDLPWDIQFSSKLNLSSGEPFYGQQCLSFAPDICRPFQGRPPRGNFLLQKAFAIRQVDIALAKNVNLGENRGGAYVRLDVLNLFAYDNLQAGPDRFVGPAGNPNFGVPDGRIAGPTRTLKLSVGYNF